LGNIDFAWFFPGIILYIIAAIIIPEGSEAYYDSGEQYEFTGFQFPDSRNKILLAIGVILIVIGGFALLKNLFPSMWGLLKGAIFPVTIILIGGAIVYSAIKNK